MSTPVPAIGDRVNESSTATGAGTLALDGATRSYQSFATAGLAGKPIEYVIVHRTANEWEVGVGQVDSEVLTRTRVKSSSAGGSAVTFSAGIKDVFVSRPTKRATTARQLFIARRG